MKLEWISDRPYLSRLAPGREVAGCRGFLNGTHVYPDVQIHFFPREEPLEVPLVANHARESKVDPLAVSY
jgi:hypothetical protein